MEFLDVFYILEEKNDVNNKTYVDGCDEFFSYDEAVKKRKMKIFYLNKEVHVIRNFLTCEKEISENSHGGIGRIEIQKVFGRKDFQGGWDFALRVVMPPNSSMGIHEHGQDEEMYIILEGEGLMTIEGEEKRVGKGDMILNKLGGKHGLLNDTNSDIELLIVQASVKQ